MAKIQKPKRIKTQDFDKEDKNVADKLGFILNVFMEEVYNALNGNLTADNVNYTYLTIKVNVDANGNMNQQVRFQNPLNGRIKGITCVRSIGTLVESNPFFDFSEASSIITVNNIKGLTANTDYQLIIKLEGE